MPTDDNASTLVGVDALLVDARNAIQSAGAALQRGGIVDLTGMAARIDELCSRAIDLPPRLARSVLPAMTDLRDAVDALIETLIRGRDG